MQINYELASKVRDYINSDDARYSFRTFINEHHLCDDLKEHGDEFSIPCPFHVDEDPSCNFNERRHVWHCLSCDRGGDRLKFFTYYDSIIGGRNISEMQKLNEILKSDAIMQADLGINTIFTSEIKRELVLKRHHMKYVHGVVYPNNFIELSTMMKEKHCSVNDIKLAILLAQKGYSVEEVYQEVMGEKVEQPQQEIYDINKILSI